MYSKGPTFRTGFSNARIEAEKVLELIVQNKLDLKFVTTKVGTWDKAIEDFYQNPQK